MKKIRIYSRHQRAFRGVLIYSLLVSIASAQAPPDPLDDQAKALMQQASTLSQTGTLTIIDSKGLRIDGTNLIGAETERPDSLIDRAAELYADDADQKGDIIIMRRAVGAWKKIPDYFSPVGFLRRTADKYRTSNPELATYCDVELARCYLGQGDSVSGLSILAGYLTVSPDSEMIGKAQALYARELLSQGRFDEASKIAQVVKTKCYNESMTYDSDDAYAIALSVLMVIPSSSQTTVVTADDKAKQALKSAEDNPRLYYELGNSALAAGNRSQAIEYWEEYRKRLPNDEQSRLLANKIAEQYLALGDDAKAIDAYRDSWTSYPDFKEGWQARIEASKLQEKAGQIQDAQDELAEGFDKTSSAAGKASILARQGELFIKNHQSDQAVEKYVILLSQYGDQNAARDAYKNLSKQAALVQDWRKATTEIQNWLIGKDTGSTPAQYGTTTLNLVGRSELRRLALNFFIQQNDAPGASGWLQTIGYASDPIERNAIIRDEAWMDSQIVQHALSLNIRAMTSNGIDDVIRTGLHGWDMAPSTEEGMDCLKATSQFALKNPNPHAGSTRDVIRELEALLGSDNDQTARQMLLPLYQAVGDKQSAQTLQQ